MIVQFLQSSSKQQELTSGEFKHQLMAESEVVLCKELEYDLSFPQHRREPCSLRSKVLL
mgnify:CR=1 FL=1